MTEDAPQDSPVSRRRYERERQARAEAERLLEEKSRDLYLANQQLAEHSARLEKAVLDRTTDLRHALDRAEAASTARSRFIATMSHEIRTPLGGLLGMIDLLSMDETDAEKLELLNYAKSAGTGLSRIVNDVLDFSKMEAGVFVFEEENVDIRALLESIRILAGSQEHSANRRIITRFNDKVPQLFLGDATRIRQVISNLVNNALRYSTDGPIVIRVTARDETGQMHLRCEVEDFGLGIAPEKLGDLFKDFTQIANPLTAAAQGTGLGLAICKRIIDRIGGTIGVESTAGEGSTFWFDLPIRPVDLHATAEERVARASNAVELSGRRVLIAEDNIINQKLLLTYCDRMGMQADLAENGRIALEKFAPGKYDLLLMDVAMPEMDGLEATRRIRDKWQADTLPPIVALTAHVMDAIEEDARAVGMDKILSKPIPFDTLKESLEQILVNRPTGARAPVSDDPKPDAVLEAANHQNAADAFLSRISQDTAAHLTDVFTHDVLIELVAKFVSDARERLDALRHADDIGNVDEVSEQAHSLKGAALMLGLDKMATVARRIETGEIAQSGQSVAHAASEFATELDDLDAALFG
ncbi:ATP-binding protein [Sagittula sp. SSi028]|uniref:ATP-binding protein n=1 Tax=Sagittula sp. SSi028 TaxID=3400636 RepID=UPI003AF7BF49